MSSKRELKEAQQRVNEAVEAWVGVRPWITFASGDPQTIALTKLESAWRDFDTLRRTFDGDAPASARDTSINAAKAKLPSKGSMRRTIVQTLVAHQAQFGTGMTCAELEARLRRSHQTVSPAVNFLEERGWIRDSEKRKKTPLGQPAIVWEPTEAAIEHIRAAGLEGS